MASAVTGDLQSTLWSAIQWVNVVPGCTVSQDAETAWRERRTQQEAGGDCDEHRSPDHGAWCRCSR